jgi:hypothetical protein
MCQSNDPNKREEGRLNTGKIDPSQPQAAFTIFFDDVGAPGFASSTRRRSSPEHLETHARLRRECAPATTGTAAAQAELELRTWPHGDAARQSRSLLGRRWPGYRWVGWACRGVSRLDTVGPFGNYRLVTLLGGCTTRLSRPGTKIRITGHARTRRIDIVDGHGDPSSPRTSEHAVVAGAS